MFYLLLLLLSMESGGIEVRLALQHAVAELFRQRGIALHQVVGGSISPLGGSGLGTVVEQLGVGQAERVADEGRLILVVGGQHTVILPHASHGQRNEVPSVEGLSIVSLVKKVYIMPGCGQRFALPPTLLPQRGHGQVAVGLSAVEVDITGALLLGRFPVVAVVKGIGILLIFAQQFQHALGGRNHFGVEPFLVAALSLALQGDDRGVELVELLRPGQFAYHAVYARQPLLLLSQAHEVLAYLGIRAQGLRLLAVLAIELAELRGPVHGPLVVVKQAAGILQVAEHVLL